MLMLFHLPVLGNDVATTMSEDEMKCFEISKKVCADGEDAYQCMKNNPNAFPSFCLEKFGNNLNDLKSTSNSAEMGTCFEAMKAHCILQTPEDETDIKVLQGAVAKYQACVNEKFAKVKACNSLTEKEREKSKLNEQNVKSIN